MSKFTFGNIVIVNNDQIGVVVKCWGDNTYEVYVRIYSGISVFKQQDIEHYIYSKELTEEEQQYYEGT